MRLAYSCSPGCSDRISSASFVPAITILLRGAIYCGYTKEERENEKRDKNIKKEKKRVAES
jgi:hypothetical protein